MSRGSILKRTDKAGRVSWRLKWELPRGPKGEREYGYKTVRGTKKQAQAALTEIFSQQDQGTYVAPAGVTVADWLETWLRDYARGRSHKTYERWAELLRLHVIPRIGGVKIQHLQATAIDAIYTDLQHPAPPTNGDKPRRPLAARTALHVHRVLFQALASAVKKRVVSRNPAEDADAPVPLKKAKLVLTEERLNALLVALEQEEAQPGYELAGWRMHEFCAYAAGTGMRLGELLALRLSDVDLDSARVDISRSVEETKEFGLQFKIPKSKELRSLPIPGNLVSIARKLRAEHARYWLEHGIRPGDPQEALMFPAALSAPLIPASPRLISQRFATRARRHRFVKFTLHGFRHTHASLLLRRGVNVKVVSERLGHSSVVITMEIYAHFMPDMQTEAAQIAGSILEKSLPGTCGVHGGLESPARRLPYVPQVIAEASELTERRVGRAVECGGLENR